MAASEGREATEQLGQGRGVILFRLSLHDTGCRGVLWGAVRRAGRRGPVAVVGWPGRLARRPGHHSRPVVVTGLAPGSDGKSYENPKAKNMIFVTPRKKLRKALESE